MLDAVYLFGMATTPLELVAFVLSVATVLLNIRQNHWAWLFAILSSGTYGIVFFGARLYGDMLLQQVFIAVSLWGWYQWKFGGPEHGRLPVSMLSMRGLAQCAVGWLASFGVLALFLSRYTDTDVPLMDGFLTAGSLVGQLLLSRKKIENWHVWIAVDVLYVGLYVYKKLFLTAILYAIFIALAVAGLRAWQRTTAPALA